jgi:hypothetical protein
MDPHKIHTLQNDDIPPFRAGRVIMNIVIPQSAHKHGITEESIRLWDVEQVVDEVIKAEEQGRLRPATKRESMAVRLAALSSIVRETRAIVENDPELVNN